MYTKWSRARKTGARTSSSLTTPSVPSRIGVFSSALNTGLRAVRMILCALSVSFSTCVQRLGVSMHAMSHSHKCVAPKQLRLGCSTLKLPRLVVKQQMRHAACRHRAPTDRRQGAP